MFIYITSIKHYVQNYYHNFQLSLMIIRIFINRALLKSLQAYDYIQQSGIYYSNMSYQTVRIFEVRLGMISIQYMTIQRVSIRFFRKNE